MIAGQSNADGVVADPLYDGLALPSGTEVNDKGVDLTNWPDGVTRNQGPLPYLDKYARLAGATEVRVVREATNGQNIIACKGDFGAIVTRLNTKGWTPQYWIYWQGEAETLDPAQSPATSYQANLEHYITMILTTFPDCRIIIVSLAMHTNDYSGVGASVDYPIVEAAQRAVCTAHPDRVLLCDSRAPTQVPLSFDEVHVSVGLDGGFDINMGRSSALWAL